MTFTIKNIRIRFSPLFFAVLALLFSIKLDNIFLIALLSSVLHEAGHLFSMLIFESRPKEIVLSFYGMKIVKADDLCLSFYKEFIVSVSGAAVNMLLFTCFSLLYYKFTTEIFLKTAAVNLLIGAFNMLPIYPLDGGRALLYFLSARHNIISSQNITNAVSLVFLVPLYYVGFYFLFSSGYNFTLLAAAVFLTANLLLK